MTGTNDFADFSRKSYGSRGVKKHFKALQPVPVRRFKSENSRRLWLFLGSLREFWRKVPGKFRENCWKIFPNREMLQILGFRAPGKANLPGTLGPHCRDLVPTFRAGCFLKSTVPAFSSFSHQGEFACSLLRATTHYAKCLINP